MLRSHTCGELRLADSNKHVTLSGWVQRLRDKGSVLWIDLRDRYGITQLIFEEGKTAPELMKAAFFFKEAIRGLSRNSAPALAALITILLTALVLGVFIPIVQATTGTANEVRGRVVLDVYVSADASPRDRSEVQSTLESTANVKSVDYI